MNKQCIIFVLKDHEHWLTQNIEKLTKLIKEFDLYFVTRDSKEQVNQILKSNNFVNISLTYDPGYYEALRSGFEFVQNLKYHTWIEFGECETIDLDEIEKLNSINKDYDYDKSVVFCSRYTKNKRSKKMKKYIYLSTGKKICDPYSKFRIYNSPSFDMMKYPFSYKMDPLSFLNFIYKKPDFIEVRIKIKKERINWRLIKEKTTIKIKLFIYAIFILPFIKRNDINK